MAPPAIVPTSVLDEREEGEFDIDAGGFDVGADVDAEANVDVNEIDADVEVSAVVVGTKVDLHLKRYISRSS